MLRIRSKPLRPYMMRFLPSCSMSSHPLYFRNHNTFISSSWNSQHILQAPLTPASTLSPSSTPGFSFNTLLCLSQPPDYGSCLSSNSFQIYEGIGNVCVCLIYYCFFKLSNDAASLGAHQIFVDSADRCPLSIYYTLYCTGV